MMVLRCYFKIWNYNTGILKLSLMGHTGAIITFIILANGDLASGSRDFTLRIWNTNVHTGALKYTLNHNNWVESLVALMWVI